MLLSSSLILLLFLKCAFSLTSNVHLKRTAYPEGAFSVSQQIGNVSSLTGCLTVEAEPLSFAAFDPQTKLCQIGSVDSAYSGPLTNSIDLYHGE